MQAGSTLYSACTLPAKTQNCDHTVFTLIAERFPDVLPSILHTTVQPGHVSVPSQRCHRRSRAKGSYVILEGCRGLAEMLLCTPPETSRIEGTLCSAGVGDLRWQLQFTATIGESVKEQIKC